MLVPRLLVLAASACPVDVRPAELANGADPVSCLVSDHECHPEPPVYLSSHPQQRLVFGLGEHHHPGRVHLRRRLEVPEWVRFEERSPSSSRDLAAQSRIASNSFRSFGIYLERIAEAGIALAARDRLLGEIDALS